MYLYNGERMAAPMLKFARGGYLKEKAEEMPPEMTLLGLVLDTIELTVTKFPNIRIPVRCKCTRQAPATPPRAPRAATGCACSSACSWLRMRARAGSDI
jgi:hypothetical protein